MQDAATKAHLLAWLGGRVKRVVVAVQAVQERRLLGGLVFQHGVGLLALGRGVVLGRGTLGAAPVALADEEGASRDARVDLAGSDLDEVRLGLDDRARATLVVDAEDLGTDLELVASRGSGQRLEELDLALAVDDAGSVEVGDAGDLDGLLGLVEVNHFLGRALESCGGERSVATLQLLYHMAVLTQEDGVGWEDGEIGMVFLEADC